MFRGLFVYGVIALFVAAPLQASAQDEDWSVCAKEGQTCRVKGESMVRFGTNGLYAFRVTRQAQPCNIDAFGSDPAPGMLKRCEISTNWRAQSSYRNWQNAGGAGRGDWLLCANEGDECRVPGGNGNTEVRYGADGRFSERLASRSIACNNGVFGDPLPGVAKQCEYKRLPGGDNSGGNAGAGGLPWSACAREGGRCDFRGAGMLRYGADGRYAYREAVGGLRCDNDSFGSDPAPGAAKRCELLRLR